MALLLTYSKYHPLSVIVSLRLTPLPPFSVIVSICQTPLPPLSAMSAFAQPPLPLPRRFCQHIQFHPLPELPIFFGRNYII